ncbi:MAG: hypothetical protein LBD06_11745 [Candidatus Accumulibacter sp.]|nr:hypothetical protein [Accumulibacter sp.]
MRRSAPGNERKTGRSVFPPLSGATAPQAYLSSVLSNRCPLNLCPLKPLSSEPLSSQTAVF